MFTVDGRLFPFLFFRTKSQKDFGFEMKDDSAFFNKLLVTPTRLVFELDT